ncbi:hypothetical protein CMI47_14600 [Candidatus Pacearchaeota archaeon]|nr:hypothetical protein [Candidatus Pacearchaeota archaeon]|tara:strand:- start:6839 stop:7546 length:708 start_codon:yes stop_codon:yes gene_type:complete
MGFLDNSTNNIIVDAVLTDYGRQLLARNDGSFSIVKFALGDDEVDYVTIKKFGRTVGKEKIEKNTPVFEAQTNQNFGLKNKLLSLSNPTLVKLPGVTLTGDVTSGKMSFKRTGSTASQSLTLSQNVTDENTIDPELRDQAFIVKLPYRFLELDGSDNTPDSIDSDDIATYIVTRDSTTTSIGGSQLTLTIKTRSISDSVFDYYGDADNKSQISSTVQVTGIQSGVVSELSIVVEK